MKQTDEARNDLGVVRIHKNVIASIASLAAVEIEGVKRVGGGMRGGILAILGRESLSSIKVEIDKHSEVKVDIPLVIAYERNIPEVAARVQESVRAALEKMTSLVVRDINVNVQGIEKE